MNQLKEKFSQYGDLEIDASLAKHTTFKIGGRAKYFLYPKNEMGLMRVIEICKENKLPYKIFGKGSNILCHDRPYDGLIICLDRYFNEYYFEMDGTCMVQAGVSLILLAHAAMKKALSGLEFASGIPATVGGALFMNAGAYKSSMSEIVEKVYVLKDGNAVWMRVEDVDYAYRHSIFQSNPEWIILGAKLKLKQGEQSEIMHLMDSRRQRRMDTQPLDKPNAGSVFRNPENALAWQLIENAGLRGMQIGGAQVSEKHANFIVNVEEAKAADVDALVKHIQKVVQENYGVSLKMEVEKFNWEE